MVKLVLWQSLFKSLFQIWDYEKFETMIRCKQRANLLSRWHSEILFASFLMTRGEFPSVRLSVRPVPSRAPAPQARASIQANSELLIYFFSIIFSSCLESDCYFYHFQSSFLDGSLHRFNQVCRSVRPSVRPSVGPSVRRSVTLSSKTRKIRGGTLGPLESRV